MKESAKTAIGHLRSHADVYGLNAIEWDKINLHVHVPEGAVPKDGPSAGITIATALISALSKRGVSRQLAMTGEITLVGRVLPIGGLREKLLAADRSEMTQIILPSENKEDLKDIPQEVLNRLQIRFAETMEQVYQYVFLGEDGENQQC
jgi:ATP-dependent Lon protease